MDSNFEWWNNPNSSHAFKLSWISLIITVLAAVGGLATFSLLNSSLMLCYGLENCVDSLSSVVCLWRFYTPGGHNPAIEEILEQREKRASIAISFVLGMLGVAIIAMSMEDFAVGYEEPENTEILYYVSFLSLLVFGVLTVFKFYYAKKLKSASMKKDGICSLIGTTLAGSLFVNTIIIMSTDGDFWWIDPTVAIIAGAVSFAIGLYGVMKPYADGYPLCSPRWWISSNVSKKGKDSQLVLSTGEQDDNSDNDEEKDDTNNQSRVV